MAMAGALHLWKWNKWEIQILVLVSFALQVLLLIFARMHWRSISASLNILFLAHVPAGRVHRDVRPRPHVHRQPGASGGGIRRAPPAAHGVLGVVPRAFGWPGHHHGLRHGGQPTLSAPPVHFLRAGARSRLMSSTSTLAAAGHWLCLPSWCFW